MIDFFKGKGEMRILTNTGLNIQFQHFTMIIVQQNLDLCIIWHIIFMNKRLNQYFQKTSVARLGTWSLNHLHFLQVWYHYIIQVKRAVDIRIKIFFLVLLRISNDGHETPCKRTLIELIFQEKMLNLNQESNPEPLVL